MKRKQSRNLTQYDRHDARASKRPRISISKSEQWSEPPFPALVLGQYYRHVHDLGSFLLQRLPSSSRVRRKRLKRFSDDHPQHSGFLTKIVIGSSDRPSTDIENARYIELSAFTQSQRIARGDSYAHRKCDISEILDFAIWRSFERDSGATKTPYNLLCYGYQTCALVDVYPEHAQRLCLPGIIQKMRNPYVEAFKQSPWTDVADILGADAETVLLALFLDCGIFQQLDTGLQNLHQICGEPISRLTPVLAIGQESRHASKQQAGKGTTQPGSITFVRSRMLYARPSLNSHGEVQLGLKHIHILNRCNDLTSAAQDVRIMQYIFPRQFGMHNVFTCKPNSRETVQPLKDYTLREEEIASCNFGQVTKVPRRLRGRVVELVQNLRKNHSRCSYTQLLRHYCHVGKLSTKVSQSIPECGTNLSSMSRVMQTQLSTQAENRIDPVLDRPTYQTSLIPHATPANQVSSFCQAVLLQLLPNDILGTGKDGPHNWNVLRHAVDHFVLMRRFESITLHAICQNLKVRGIAWLCPPSMQFKDNMSRSDCIRRLEILHELMYYIFDSLLIPLIRSNFYVTESGAYRYRILYFRHDIWKRMIEPSLAHMRLSQFKPLKSHQLKHALASNSLGYSQMRLLPKLQGLRPIMNLKKRSMRTIKGRSVLGSSINGRLAPVFSILNLERLRQPERLASAMFSVNDMQQKLRDFKARSDHTDQKRLYFVKVDILSCFDTIPQEELILLMQKMLSERQYQITKHIEIKHPNTHGGRSVVRPFQRTVLRAVGISDSAFLDEQVAASLANRKRQHTFVDMNQQRSLSSSQVHKALSDHVQQNIVRIGRKHFRQAEGIPQGSVLSSLLCNFFYGDFERENLNFLDPRTSVLLRLIDDFLLITTSEMQAKGFVQAIYRGSGRYGIHANPDKSLVNFEISVDGHKIPRVISGTHFPYCGMIIDSRSLQIRKDRQARDLHVENGLTVGRSGKIGTALSSRIVASLKRQMHRMLFDDRLNTTSLMFSTVFECYFESGMKLHRYLRCLKGVQRPSQAYLIGLCKQLVDHGFKTIHSNQTQNANRLTRAQATWLASSALMKALDRKQSAYAEVLRWLRVQQWETRTSMNMTAWSRRHLVDDCVKPFADYVY